MGHNRRLQDVGDTARVLQYSDGAQSIFDNSPEYLSVANEITGRGEPAIESPGESVSKSSQGANAKCENVV